MKELLAITALVLLPSCVTSSDLRQVAEELSKVEAVAMDNTKTSDDLLDQINASVESIGTLADSVDDRTDGFIKGIGTTGEGGILAVAAAMGLNFYRNRQRKRRDEPV